MTVLPVFNYLRFQHCTGHITTGSWKGRGNQYIQFVRVLYCKLLTNGKQLPAVPGTESWPQRWEVRVLPLCHRGPAPCPVCKTVHKCSVRNAKQPAVSKILICLQRPIYK